MMRVARREIGWGLLLAFGLSIPISAFSQTATRAAAESKVIARTDSAATAAKAAASSATSAKKLPATRSTVKKRLVSAKSTPAHRNILINGYATYGDSTVGDDPSRDDPAVRAAAVSALGDLLGSVVVVDPSNGRVLTVVNQQMAFAGGYQPCSAFKPAVALAALGEGIIDTDRTKLTLGKKWQLDLNKALAISNNLYFEKLGRLLGIDKLEQYARQFGFGEQAGFGITPEPAGAFPDAAPPASMGGVGRVASFGQGISMTLFQLASFTSALSNGGTLYYLQYPADGSQAIEPKIKREISWGPSLDAVRAGMEEAVLEGTARRANMGDLHVLGKTGTCSQNGARLGWFTGYIHQPGGVALAVLLRTGMNVGGGARASQVAGQIFRQLYNQDYYARNTHSDPSRALPAAFQIP